MSIIFVIARFLYAGNAAVLTGDLVVFVRGTSSPWMRRFISLVAREVDIGIIVPF